MKKRGGSKASGGSRRKTVKRRRKRKTAPHVPHKKRRVAASQLVSDEAAEVISAESVLEKEERFIRKDVRLLLSPQEFHVVTFVCALIILSFIFSSMSLIFYAILTIGVLLFANHLKQHHRPHDIISIVAIFFLPLAVTIIAFRDVLVWLLLAVYIISVVSTVIIYYHHRKAHGPLKIMWQVTYSRVVAITLALLLALILPSIILGDFFVNIFELIFMYVLPVAFVFFFLSKFLYLYFFDRKHIRHDLAKSLRHTITYTLVFIVLMMCIYSLFAVGFYNSRNSQVGISIDHTLLLVSEVDKTVMNLPTGLQALPVTKDMLGFSSELNSEVSLAKNNVVERTISFGEIMDDSYLGTMGDDAFQTLRFTMLTLHLASLKDEIVTKYGLLGSNGGNLSDDQLSEQASQLRAYVEDEFVPYAQDPDFQELLALLDDPSATYSDFEDNGIFYWFAYDQGLEFVYNSESIFGRQMSLVLRHTQFFRYITKLSMKSMLLVRKEADSSSTIERLYENRDSDTIPLSNAIRYGIMKDFIDSRKEFYEQNLEEDSEGSSVYV